MGLRNQDNAIKSTELTRVKSGNFNEGRSLADYNNEFAGELRGRLRNLRQTDRWIDMGAGSAAAMQNFFRDLSRKTSISEFPQAIAVAYQVPDFAAASVELALKTYADRFIFVEGLRSPTQIGQFPKADVITDVMGIFTYAKNKEQVIRSYIAILNPGGIAFINSYESDLYLISAIASRIPGVRIRKVGLYSVAIEKQ